MTSTITIVGNCTKEPELRFLPNGTPVANFGVAVNRRWQNKQTEQWEESVSFFNVTCWRDLAENVAETLQKGSRVIVTGRLEQRSWDDQDGNKRSVVEVVADEAGPSCRWATCEITRNERKSESASGGGGGDPWGGGSAGQAPATAYDPAEEPF